MKNKTSICTRILITILAFVLLAPLQTVSARETMEVKAYGKAEQSECTVSDLVYEPDRALVMENIRRRMAFEEETIRYAFRGVKKNGEIIQVEVHGSRSKYRGEPAVIGTLLDITAQKEAEEALLKRKERYRNLFENAPIAIWEKDFSKVKSYLDALFENRDADPESFLLNHPEHVQTCASLCNVIDVNQAALELFGATDKNALLSLESSFTDISYRAYCAELATIFKGGLRIETEATVMRLDGTERHVALRWSVSPGYGHSYGRVLITMVDVTERKRAETLATENEERLRLALSAARGGSFFCDYYPGETRWDDYSQDIFGVHLPDGVVDYQMWLDRVHPDDRERVGREYDRALAQERNFDLEYRIIRPDGKLRYVRASGLILRNPHGKAERVYGLHFDITDQKEAGIRLQDSLRINKLLLETTLDGFILADEKGEIVDVNPAYCRKVGYSREELIGMNILDLEAVLSPELVARRISEVFESGSKRFQTKHRRKDGEIVELDASLVAVQPGNKALVAGFVRNITEQKRIEREREKLISDLESQNAELERFTYTVSHDLKSPLVTIQGFLGFLRQDALAGNYEAIEHDLNRIQTAAKTMQALLNDLLELSRVGHVVGPARLISTDELLEETTSLIAGELSEKNVELSVARGLPALYGDKDRLKEVFQNLISNAVKFMGEQPHPKIVIAASRTDGGVKCQVSDNGMGIPEAYHLKIFDLFERLHHDIEGTGIGLALVKRIVELHGGRIWVESGGDRYGSTFFFTLPDAPEA